MKHIYKGGTIEWQNPWTDRYGFENCGSHGTKFPSVIWGDDGRTTWHCCGIAWRKQGSAELGSGGRQTVRRRPPVGLPLT